MSRKTRLVRALKSADLWQCDAPSWRRLTMAVLGMRAEDMPFIAAAWDKYGQGTPIPGYGLPLVARTALA
jgi:hypothetical protein